MVGRANKRNGDQVAQGAWRVREGERTTMLSKTYQRVLSAGVAASALVPALAFAQATVTEEPAASGDDEIIVTGTLIRGGAPVGQTVIAKGPEEAQAQGATTANEILATIPQVSNLFVTVPTSRLGIAANQIQIVRPNLRNLSEETGSSASTLVLVDGHRLAGAGVTQSSLDPDIIPQAALERVEVVTDGGSATYGADAVGGVINFITRKRYDGVKVDARYGFADDYWTFDANALVGKDWGTGSLYAAYSFQKNDALFGRDRDFIRAIDYATGIPIGRSCDPGTVQIGVFNLEKSIAAGAAVFDTTNFALPNLTPNTFNACDSTDEDTIVPEAVRHSALVGLHQDLNESITVDLRAFYGSRTSKSFGPIRGQATVTSNNAFYRPIAANPTANQTVFYTFEPILGDDAAISSSGYEEWGANAEFQFRLSDRWELRTLFNYSQSYSFFYNQGTIQSLLTAAGSASDPQQAVNFYDPAATPNLNVIRAIANGETAGQAKDRLFNLRGILSGTLLDLPGGEVRVAGGYEYLHEGFSSRTVPTSTPRGAIENMAYTHYRRRVHSLFGELQVPIFGDGNRTGGLYSLVLSGSVRYDNFSDFGSTVNPKVGVNYKPVDWLTLRGNYSTSFNAPSPVAQLASLNNTLSFFPFNAFVRPEDVGNIAQGVAGTIALQGSTPNLRPQTATTWSIGADIEPPFIPGLRGSISYYNVSFRDILTIPNPSPQIFVNFPNNVLTDRNGLTVQQLQSYINSAPNGSTVIPAVIAAQCNTPNVPTSRCNVYEVVNFLVGNYGNLKVRGLDFNLNYRQPTGFGGVDASISGNYQLERTSQLGPGASPTDGLQFGTPKLTMQTTLGADVGNFRGQVTWNHVAGYDIQPLPSGQTHVDSFNVINLFFRYTVPGESLLTKDLAFTLNVNNVFDTDPPEYRTSGFGGNGYPQGQFTLGRLIMFGVSKEF
jgi:iron complex outermembrane recepter protein